jgi:porphobilinogen synthase
MVKPAMIYGDLIREIKDRTTVPMATYSVSGEYAMIKGAAKLGLIDEEALICETAVAAYRSGADIYLTYFAPELARFMKEGRIG